MPFESQFPIAVLPYNDNFSDLLTVIKTKPCVPCHTQSTFGDIGKYN